MEEPDSFRRVVGCRFSALILALLCSVSMQCGPAHIPERELNQEEPHCILKLDQAFSKASIRKGLTLNMEELNQAAKSAGGDSQEQDRAPASRGERPVESMQGTASWYGGSDGLDGMLTASGEIFNAAAMTAAHPALPFGTKVRVTYLKNGRSVVVRINDRGPFLGNRIIDLSRGAAEAIGLSSDGIGEVKLEILR